MAPPWSRGSTPKRARCSSRLDADDGRQRSRAIADVNGQTVRASSLQDGFGEVPPTHFEQSSVGDVDRVTHFSVSFTMTRRTPV